MTIDKINVKGTSYEIVPSKILDQGGNVIEIPQNAKFTDTVTNSWYNFTLNGRTLGVTDGTNLGNAYAPVTAGEEGQILISSGSGAPVWVNSNSISSGTNKYYIQIGGNSNGSVTYNGHVYQNGATIDTDNIITVEDLIPTQIEGYNCGVTVQGLVITVTYKQIGAFVDLGLSVKWATGNLKRVGENQYVIGNETEEGSYFSWGDVIGSNGSGYTEDFYSFSSDNYNNNVSGTGSTLTASIPTGSVDNDPASKWLGMPWRMPTYQEFQELVNTKNDTANYTWEFIHSDSQAVYGKAGYRITRNSTGESLFIPAAGAYVGSNLDSLNNRGYLWASTMVENDHICYCIGLNNDTAFAAYMPMPRYSGCSIRPVQ